VQVGNGQKGGMINAKTVLFLIQQNAGNRAIAPSPKYSQMYVFFRYSNQLHHFVPPKILVGFGPDKMYCF